MRRYTRMTNLLDKDRTKLDFVMNVYGPGMKEVSCAANTFIASYNRIHDRPIKGGHGSIIRRDPDFMDISLIEDITKLPNVVCGMGFGEYMSAYFKKHYVETGVFEKIDYPNEPIPLFGGIDLSDPSGSYHIYGGSAMVMLVDTRKLEGLPIPLRWDDLLDSRYRGKVVTGFNIDDINEFFPLYFYREHGKEGIRAFAENLAKPIDTLDMMRSSLRQHNDHAIFLMPHFFACAAPQEDYLIEVWPDDGALLVPYYALARDTEKESVQSILRFIMGDTFAQTITGRKMFHIYSDLDHKFDGRSFKWLGWEWLHDYDIIKTMHEIDGILIPILLRRYPELQRDRGHALWNG